MCHPHLLANRAFMFGGEETSSWMVRRRKRTTRFRAVRCGAPRNLKPSRTSLNPSLEIARHYPYTRGNSNGKGPQMSWNRSVFGGSGYGALSASHCVNRVTRIWRSAHMPPISILHRRVGNDEYEMWLCPGASSLAPNVLASFGFKSSVNPPRVELYQKVSF